MISKIAKAIVLSAAAAFLTMPVYGQSITGTWIGNWRTLDNGENDRMFLNLQQTDTKLAGTVTTIGHVWQVTGTVAGAHFEIFFSPRDTKPRVVGEIAGQELHLTREGDQFVAVPTKPGEEYPAFEHIEPPVLHDVPYNGLAKTPPMGWNSWNLFQSHVDDKTVRGMADAMVTSGMRDAGYVYVNIDDTWEGVRDAQGNLGSNKKFPDMKALADYVHSKGLKLGVYSSPGPRTCAEYPGSYGHEQQDANTFAAWGIDYLKYDWCGARMIYVDKDLQAVYQKMGDALLKTGRPIVYSLCEYGNGKVETWGAKSGGNLWRTTGDIRDTWSSMIANIERQVPAAPYTGPGHWNDPDMLEIGNGGMTADEYRTHMTLWAITASPLLAGNDIRNMTPQIKEILMNHEVIAVDQDSLGKQASPIKKDDLETWVKPLSDGSIAVAVVNKAATEAAAKVNMSDLGLGANVKSARDLWAHEVVAFQDGVYSAKIPSHGVLLLRVRMNKSEEKGAAVATPCLDVLNRFTAANVPVMAPEEEFAAAGNPTAVAPANLPGNGLSQHPMLYVGENCNKMFLVKDGKAIWTYSTGKGPEYDDVWMLSNGNILFTRMKYIAEITPDKKVIWRYDFKVPKGPDHTEVHTCQPIGLDKVMFVVNGLPPKLMVINIKTGAVEVDHELPHIEPSDPNRIHGQFRRARVTDQGTYLVSFLNMNRVVEYDKDFKEVWKYEIPSPWAALRLKNGNTLITDEQESLTREVNPKGETVWEFNCTTDLPTEYRFTSAPQSCTRLANGNTIFASRGKGGQGPQLIEVTRDKKVVWVLQDWENVGDATAVQILDDPGVPEIPGQSEH